MRSKAMKLIMGLVFGVLIAGGVVVGRAQEPVRQTFQFYLDGKIGGEVVKKGNYEVTFTEGEQGKLEIKVGKKVITTQFTRRATEAAASTNQMTYRDNGDGTLSVATLTPKGRKYTLVLTNENVSVATK